MKSGTRRWSGTLAAGRYFFRSVTFFPAEITTSSSRKKLSVVSVDFAVRITWAASAMISVVREPAIVESPPSRFCTAAVWMAVLGHRVLHAIPSSLNSPARPYREVVRLVGGRDLRE